MIGVAEYHLADVLGEFNPPDFGGEIWGGDGVDTGNASASGPRG